MPMDTSISSFGQVLRKLFMTNVRSLGSHSQATAVPGHCHEIAPQSNCHISKLIPPIEVFLNILESSYHELRIAYGLTLMTPSLYGWNAFPTPSTLIHTRIIWALSPMAPQVPGVTPRSPLCPGYFGHSIQRGAQHNLLPSTKTCNTPCPCTSWYLDVALQWLQFGAQWRQHATCWDGRVLSTTFAYPTNWLLND